MFASTHRLGSVELAFTDRHGPTRGGPSASWEPLDLATVDAGLDPARSAAGVRARRCAVAALTGSPDTPTVAMHQVHGTTVVRASRRTDGELPACDALVTDEAGVVLLVRVADCVPVVLADPEAGVVAAVHAGRSGMAAGVVCRTVERLHELGARSLTAWLGPHVCGACYEVPAELRDEVAAAVPAARAQTSWGTPALDIGAGVRAQLATAGVEVAATGPCTRESPDLFSYRRDGAAAGRLAGLVWRRP